MKLQGERAKQKYARITLVPQRGELEAGKRWRELLSVFGTECFAVKCLVREEATTGLFEVEKHTAARRGHLNRNLRSTKESSECRQRSRSTKHQMSTISHDSTGTGIGPDPRAPSPSEHVDVESYRFQNQSVGSNIDQPAPQLPAFSLLMQSDWQHPQPAP